MNEGLQLSSEFQNRKSKISVEILIDFSWILIAPISSVYENIFKGPGLLQKNESLIDTEWVLSGVGFLEFSQD